MPAARGPRHVIVRVRVTPAPREGAGFSGNGARQVFPEMGSADLVKIQNCKKKNVFPTTAPREGADFSGYGPSRSCQDLNL